MTEYTIEKPGNQGNRVQVIRITGNQDTVNLFYICRESSTNRAFLCKTKPIFVKAKWMYLSLLQRIMKELAPAAFRKAKPIKAN